MSNKYVVVWSEELEKDIMSTMKIESKYLFFQGLSINKHFETKSRQSEAMTIYDILFIIDACTFLGMRTSCHKYELKTNLHAYVNRDEAGVLLPKVKIKYT